jgi:hypothetical protein
MAQQTAVEWYSDILLGLMIELATGVIVETEYHIKRRKAFEQAKQMEKGQIQDAWHDGNFLGRNGNLFVDYNTKEGYYKSEFENK